MKQVLILSRKGSNTSSLKLFTDTINAQGSKTIKAHFDTFGKLKYSLIDGKTKIYSSKLQKDIKDFDLIIFRHWHKTQEQATTCYLHLKRNNCKMLDTELENFRATSKLSEYFLLATHCLPVPNTIYTKQAFLLSHAKSEKISFPIILKDAFLHKGASNFYAEDEKSAEQILKNNKKANFIIQEFIPNECDYRVLVFNQKPSLCIKRSRIAKETHLNNTSQGAKASIVPLTKLSQQLLDDVVKAAYVTKRGMAGVDLMISSKNNKHFILEVNNLPQLRTGSFADEKMKNFTKAIEEEIEK